jgi:tRNA A37 methylthiotransferase MiaB
MFLKKPNIILSTVPWYSLFGANLTCIPTGLAFVAGALERLGYSARIINPDSLTFHGYSQAESYSNESAYEKNLSDPSYFIWAALEQFLRKNPFDIFGVSVMITQFPAAHFLSQIAKKVNPDALIIWGGIGVTVKPEWAFDTPASVVDYVIRGEGEQTIVNLIKCLEEDRSVGDVKGISYLSSNGIIHNPDAGPIRNLDDIPHPAKHLYTSIDGTAKAPPYAYSRLFTSRGCPFQCTYCDSNKLWSRKVRNQSAEYVVEEIELLKKHFSVKMIVFDDDTFALDSKACDHLLDLMIERHLNVSWRCETRANLVTDKLLTKMKKAGCKSITLGVESGNEETLKKIKKGVTKDQIRHAAKLIKQQGILLNGFFMFGFPWETEQEMKNTLDFIYELGPNGEVGAVISFLIPYPGTQLYNDIVEQGLMPDVPMHLMHHRNRTIKFAKNISQERFKELTAEIETSVNKYNGTIRSRLILKDPAYFLLNLQQRGYLNPKFLLSAASDRLKRIFYR